MDGLKFYIPLSAHGFMELPLDELPDSESTMNDLLEVLRGEIAPLELWLALAKVYLSQNKVHNFLRLMEEACSPEAAEYYQDYSRIRMLCVLAAYHTNIGRMEKGQRRNDAFYQARQLLQIARRIDFTEQLPLIGSAQLHLAQNQMLQAKQELEQARLLRNNGEVNVAPVVALANMALQAGNTDEALNRYKRALMDHPGGPAELRLGIAICYYRKGNHARAKAAFERVLELDPKNIEALQCLAVMKFNSESVQDKREALELIQDAFHFDPTNSGVLNMLAHQHLIRGEYEKVESLARAALQNTERDKTRAGSMLLIARAAHALQKFPEASTYYQQAARLDDSLALPHFGLAQMAIRNREYKNAISELEAVLQAVPSSFDALRVLGKLYKQQPQRVEKAIGGFFEQFDMSKESALLNSETWEMFGELQSIGNPKGALSAYSKALELGEQKGLSSTDSARIMNNSGVLHFQLGEMQEAKQLMRQALEKAAEGDSNDNLSVATMKFNMARIHEATANFKDASELYEAVLAGHPGYMACYLRLAAMGRIEGKRQVAQEWLEKAIKQDPRCMDAHAMMATLHMERRNFLATSESVKEMLKIDKNDPCALLIKGNLSINAMPTARKKGQTPGEWESSRKEYFAKALECYKMALAKEPCNAYAANGLGVVLAEEGSMTAAKSVFTQVQEAVAASQPWQNMLPDAHLNLANVHLACQDYVSAIKLYQTVLSRPHNNKDSSVLLYLARAYYDSENLVEAKRTLLKAIHVAPTDHGLRFNLAVVMQQYAVQKLHTFKAEKNPADRLEGVEVAKEELSQALRFFRRLMGQGPAVTGIENVKLEMHTSFCADIAMKAEVLHEAASREAKASEKKLDSQRLALESQKMLAQVSQEKLRLKEQREREERERQALEAQQKLDRLKEQWQENAEMRTPEPKGKKRKAKGDEGEYDEDNTGQDGLDVLEQRAEAQGEEASSDEEEGSRHRIKKKHRSAEDEQLADIGLDDLEDEPEPEGNAPPEDDEQRRRGAVLDDDDDDDVAEGHAAPGGEGTNINDLFGSESDED